jgi:hypothetical protein
MGTERAQIWYIERYIQVGVTKMSAAVRLFGSFQRFVEFVVYRSDAVYASDL